MATKNVNSVSIGKFDVLATYTYPKALLAGADDSEAKERGMVAAIMGARARLGYAESRHEDYQADKKAAEKKKKTTITAGSFDRQVSGKLGKYFDTTLLPAISTARSRASWASTSTRPCSPPSRDWSRRGCPTRTSSG